eukprot:NODE_577_length_6546_cov_0.420971.p2 type:complete len:501 gc:universal NODE_577_length_6546_cov_0.420971:4554-3052(-)
MLNWILFWISLIFVFTLDIFTDSEISRVSYERKNSDSEFELAGPEYTVVYEMIEHSFAEFLDCCSDNDFMENGHGYNINPHSMILTAIDGLDTLILYHKIKNNNMSKSLLMKAYSAIIQNDIINDQTISMFEMHIRVTGGLLGAASLLDLTDIEEIKKSVLIDKAAEFVNLNLKSYSNIHEVPYALINVRTGINGYQSWTPHALLSEVGSHQLEFKYLDMVIQDKSKYDHAPFSAKSDTAFKSILSQSTGLYNAFINVNTNELVTSSEVGIGAFSDSFYEYILKMYILTGDEYYKVKFIQVALEIEKQLLVEYIIDKEPVLLARSSVSNAFDHLSCFMGGVYALASTVIPEYSVNYLNLAIGLTHGCYAVYKLFPTGLGPDICSPSFKNDTFKCSVKSPEYKLRPELVESIYYLYKVTNDSKYREWNLEIARNINKYCRNQFGYVNVNVETKEQGTRQDSWFVAETLKYLLLTFENNNMLPVDEFVFNTEAHPFRLMNKF